MLKRTSDLFSFFLVGVVVKQVAGGFHTQILWSERAYNLGNYSLTETVG